MRQPAPPTYDPNIAPCTILVATGHALFPGTPWPPQSHSRQGSQSPRRARMARPRCSPRESGSSGRSKRWKQGRTRDNPRLTQIGQFHLIRGVLRRKCFAHEGKQTVTGKIGATTNSTRVKQSVTISNSVTACAFFDTERNSRFHLLLTRYRLWFREKKMRDPATPSQKKKPSAQSCMKYVPIDPIATVVFPTKGCSSTAGTGHAIRFAADTILMFGRNNGSCQAGTRHFKTKFLSAHTVEGCSSCQVDPHVLLLPPQMPHMSSCTPLNGTPSQPRQEVPFPPQTLHTSARRPTSINSFFVLWKKLPCSTKLRTYFPASGKIDVGGKVQLPFKAEPSSHESHGRSDIGPAVEKTANRESSIGADVIHPTVSAAPAHGFLDGRTIR